MSTKFNTFEQKLAEMFGTVEAAFREGEVRSYRAQADAQVAAWLKRVEAGPVKGPGVNWRVNCPPEYVLFVREHLDKKLEPGDVFALNCGGFEERKFGVYKKLAAMGEFKPNYDKAEKDANAAVDAAKAHFISKQGKKLATAFGNRTDIASIEGQLVYQGVITGWLKVTCKNGDQFTLDMNMIVNHRYEPHFTSFYQYPSRFTSVSINGKPPAKGTKLSEEWMAEHFGGKPLPPKPPPKPRRKSLWRGYRR